MSSGVDSLSELIDSRSTMESCEDDQHEHAHKRGGFARRNALGLGLLAAGAGILGWQYKEMFLDSDGERDAATSRVDAFRDSHPSNGDCMTVGGKHDPALQEPPRVSAPSYGEQFGVLIVPKWESYTENRMPIVEGTGSDVLDLANAGHYPSTQLPGEVGNFALAGHRRTMGNSFRRVDVLDVGDALVVESADTYYVYRVRSWELVVPDGAGSEVLASVPKFPSAQPSERLITLTTCHDTRLGEWGSNRRWIVYGVMEYWTPKSEGVAPDLSGLASLCS